MKLRLIYFLVLSFFSLPVFSFESHEAGVKLRVQMENTSTDVEGATASKSIFKLAYARFAFKGSDGPWNYYVRWRFNKSASNTGNTDTVSDNVDYAQVAYKYSDKLKITMGKVLAYVGAWELCEGGFKTFMFSDAFKALPLVYASGAQFQYTFGKQWVGVQFLNSPTETDDQQETGDMAVLASYYGNFSDSKIFPIISLGTIPRHIRRTAFSGVTKVDDKVNTTHYALGLRTKAAGYTISVETTSLTTAAYTSHEMNTGGTAIVTTDNEESTVTSEVVKIQTVNGKHKPYLKLIKGLTKNSNETNSYGVSLGSFYKPSPEHSGEFHMAALQTNSEVKDGDTTKVGKLIFGFTLSL
jgi:hypothetical protein